MIGQRGPLWLLAGRFDGGTTVRTCSLPEGRALFVPVANSVQIDSRLCGSGPKPIPVAELRAAAAKVIDDFTKLSVRLDGRPITNFRRVRSVVFEVALPERNLFDAPCSSAGGVPPVFMRRPLTTATMWSCLRFRPAGTGCAFGRKIRARHRFRMSSTN